MSARELICRNVSSPTETTIRRPVPPLLIFVALMQSKGAVVGDEEVLEDAIALAGVSKYPARIKCALLGWMAFKDASVQAQAKSELE